MSFTAELWGRTTPLEDPTPKSPEGGTTDLVIRQARIIHELRTELEALKKFTACTRSHPHEAMAQDCELRTEIARLTNELAGLRAAPAVPQGETVAWMVCGNYTRQPFGMLSSAEAYMRGLLKSDPDGGYHIRPLRYATPAPAQEFNKSVADAEIKALYVESQGSDKGWLGIEGSYFIGGVVAARKQKAAPEPAQGVGLTDEALDNLIEDLSEWSRHVVEDTAHQTLEAHVREVLATNPIIAALRVKGGK